MITDINLIRRAVCQRRGGITDASDDQIMRLWQSLSNKVQAIYLDNAKSEQHNAISHRPATNI